MYKLISALLLFSLVAIGQTPFPSPGGPNSGGGGGGGGATIPSVTNLLKGDGAGNGADAGFAPSVVVRKDQANTLGGNLLFTDATYDIGASGATRPRNIFLSGAATIPGGVTTGGTPPALTPGTGGPIALGEGTAPSVCAATSVDCLYADATRHALLGSFNNDTYAILVRGPASTVNNHIAAFNGTSGGLLQDGGVLGTAAAVSSTCSGTDFTGTLPGCLVQAIGGKAVTLGGALTFSGAFGTTFTVTGTTSVTLPTSGTLLSSASTVFNSVTYPSSFNSGGIPYASASGTIASSGAGVQNAMMAWGGVGNAPTSPLSLLVTNQNAASETWTWYNSTATTGKTLMAFRNGAGAASGDALFPFYANNGTTVLGGFYETGANSSLILNTAELAIGNTVPGNPFGSSQFIITNGEVYLNSNQVIGWSSANSGIGAGAGDTSLHRGATPGLMDIGNGSNCTTATNCRDLRHRHSLASGAAPTITSGGGGTGSAIAGADESGRVTVGTSVSTGSIVIAFGTSFSNAPPCSATDETNAATIVVVCIGTTGGVTLTSYSRTTGVAGNFTASDAVSWAVPHGY
jgi:hypothetical protein